MCGCGVVAVVVVVVVVVVVAGVRVGYDELLWFFMVTMTARSVRL